MSKVLVLDTNKRSLNPIHPGRARTLLSAEKAAVLRRYPFTIIMKHEIAGPIEPLQLKIDPGSKTTGMVLVQGETVILPPRLNTGASELGKRWHQDVPCAAAGGPGRPAIGRQGFLTGSAIRAGCRRHWRAGF